MNPVKATASGSRAPNVLRNLTQRQGGRSRVLEQAARLRLGDIGRGNREPVLRRGRLLLEGPVEEGRCIQEAGRVVPISKHYTEQVTVATLRREDQAVAGVIREAGLDAGEP